MQGRELLARRDFAPRRVENCPRVGILLHEELRTAFASGFCFAQGRGLRARGYFAPRRVGNCVRVGILLCILRHSYGVHPVTLVYQGLRYRLPLPKIFRPVGACFYQGLCYRLPLPEVFRPVGAGFSFSKQKCKVIPTENRIFAR